MENRDWARSWASLGIFFVFYVVCTPSAVIGTPKGDVRNELPAPVGAQALTLKKTITLSWQWQPPEVLPVFIELGYEVKRQDGTTFKASDTTYADTDLFPGTYTYTVRVRGVAKEKGKTITYVSDWSEPVQGLVNWTCPRAPSIELSVEPTQKTYASIPSLRFHLKGRASVDAGCTLEAVTYRLDTGAGIVHTGPLPVDAKGNFDTFINAFGPEDEIPSGRESFSITAAAKNETGSNTSSAYSIDIELKNPFAPDKPEQPQ